MRPRAQAGHGLTWVGSSERTPVARQLTVDLRSLFSRVTVVALSSERRAGREAAEGEAGLAAVPSLMARLKRGVVYAGKRIESAP